MKLASIGLTETNMRKPIVTSSTPNNGSIRGNQLQLNGQMYKGLIQFSFYIPAGHICCQCCNLRAWQCPILVQVWSESSKTSYKWILWDKYPKVAPIFVRHLATESLNYDCLKFFFKNFSTWTRLGFLCLYDNPIALGPKLIFNLSRKLDGELIHEKRNTLPPTQWLAQVKKSISLKIPIRFFRSPLVWTNLDNTNLWRTNPAEHSNTNVIRVPRWWPRGKLLL